MKRVLNLAGSVALGVGLAWGGAAWFWATSIEGAQRATEFRLAALSDALTKGGLSPGALDVIRGEVIEKAETQWEWTPQIGVAPGREFTPELHGIRKEKESNAEAFDRIAGYVWDRRKELGRLAADGKAKEAIVALGQALAALQSLVARSNWVDLSPDARQVAADRLLVRKGGLPPGLNIAAIASRGGSPPGDAYGIDAFDKMGPGASADANAAYSGDLGKAKHEACLQEARELGAKWIESALAELPEASRSAIVRFEPDPEGLASAFRSIASRQSLQDAALASVVVPVGGTAVLNNPFDSPTTVKVLATGETRTVEPHGNLNLVSDQERILLQNPTAGTVMLKVSVAEDAPPAPNSIAGVWSGGKTVDPIPIYGGVTPLLVVDGDAPKGSTVAFEVVDRNQRAKIVPGVAWLSVLSRDGRLRRSLCRFEGVDAPASSTRATRLVILDSSGIVIASRPVRTVDASLKVSLSPIEGRPGSSATVTIDGTALRSALRLDRPLFAESRLVVRIDYSLSGGATGPRIAPFPFQGQVEFQVTRGASPGAFQLIVIPALRSALFSDAACGGGPVRVRGRSVELSPHARGSLPGCPYCGAPPLRTSKARPERCPGASLEQNGKVRLFTPHEWGADRACPVCSSTR